MRYCAVGGNIWKDCILRLCYTTVCDLAYLTRSQTCFLWYAFASDKELSIQAIATKNDHTWKILARELVLLNLKSPISCPKNVLAHIENHDIFHVIMKWCRSMRLKMCATTGALIWPQLHVWAELPQNHPSSVKSAFRETLRHSYMVTGVPKGETTVVKTMPGLSGSFVFCGPTRQNDLRF